jgi:hypothetical protein
MNDRTLFVCLFWALLIEDIRVEEMAEYYGY